MGTWPTLSTSALDLTQDTWDLTQTLANDLGDLGTAHDGFDVYLSETFLLLGGFGDLVGSLGDDLILAAGITSLIDPNSLAADVAALPGDLATGDAILADAGALLGSVGPAPPAGGSGGGGSGGGTPATPCGTHGNSSIRLGDNTQNCDAATALPVVSIADGPCSFAFLMDNTTFAGTATVTSTSIKTGDTRLWSIANDSVKSPNTGALVSRVTLTLRPYKTGHFFARCNVFTNRKSPEVWCILIDVVP